MIEQLSFPDTFIRYTLGFHERNIRIKIFFIFSIKYIHSFEPYCIAFITQNNFIMKIFRF